MIRRNREPRARRRRESRLAGGVADVRGDPLRRAQQPQVVVDRSHQLDTDRQPAGPMKPAD
jgi:hypothetical protein